MLSAYKKLVVERKIDDKVFQFMFDEDSSLGSLYQAADEFRAFITGQINSQGSSKEEEGESKEEDSKESDSKEEKSDK